MARQRIFDGELSQFETPDWRPLEQLVDDDVAALFMWMHEVQLSDGSLVQAYKHIHTRRYIHADSAGRTFVYDASDRYREVPPADLLEAVFVTMPGLAGVTEEDLLAARRAVERHRSE